MHRYDRRNFLKMAGLAAVGSQLPLAAFAETMKSGKPNILFIAVDDLRPELGCYGVSAVKSPNMDRLAQEGVVFSRAYCQVPVCGASRASLLTGLRPTPKRFRNYRTWAEKDAPGIVDLPGWFKQHGYETFSMGKIYHHGRDNENSWTKRGSDLIQSPGFKDYKKLASRSKGGNKAGVAYEWSELPDDRYFTGQLANAAIERLRRIKAGDKPGFLAVGFTKPHLPFVAPKKYWDLYDRRQLELAPNPFKPDTAPDRAMHNFNELRGYDGIPKGKNPIPKKLARTLKHGYYACVSFADAMVGRILDELDELGMRENTIVVLWGDHGWQLGEHKLWCKHSNFNTSLQAPLIIRAPKVKGGAATDALVEFVDIYPTLCKMSGLPLPNHLQGTSLLPLLKKPNREWKQAVFARYHAGESVRTDQYLYTEWRKGGAVVDRMLYDHAVDPMENVNIAETPEGKTVCTRLSKVLQKGWKPIAAQVAFEQ